MLEPLSTQVAYLVGVLHLDILSNLIGNLVNLMVSRWKFNNTTFLRCIHPIVLKAEQMRGIIYVSSVNAIVAARFIGSFLAHSSIWKPSGKDELTPTPPFSLYSHMKAPFQLFHYNYHSPNYPGVHTFPNKQLKIKKKKKEINDVIQTKCADNLMWRISFGNDWAGGMTVSRKKRVIIWSCQGLFRTSHYWSLHWFWSIWLRCPPK